MDDVIYARRSDALATPAHATMTARRMARPARRPTSLRGPGAPLAVLGLLLLLLLLLLARVAAAAAMQDVGTADEATTTGRGAGNTAAAGAYGRGGALTPAGAPGSSRCAYLDPSEAAPGPNQKWQDLADWLQDKVRNAGPRLADDHGAAHRHCSRTSLPAVRSACTGCNH